MSDQNHTPGPWTDSPVSSVVGSLISCNGKNVAAAMPQEWSVETKANAKLIAAAPEMLEACILLLPYAQDYDENKMNPAMKQRAKEIIKKAKAAIAKAKGETV